MRIVFFGTSEFAVPSLEALLRSKHNILAVVTQPDRKKGRSLKLSQAPVKVAAERGGVSVYQPQDASGAESVARLRALRPDLFVVIAFGQILKKEALDIPSIFSVNIHGSLLPKYRGAAPTNWAIINGDKVTGVTAIKLNEKMDAGDIIYKEEVAIESRDTNAALTEKLASCGASVLTKAIEMVEVKGKTLPLIRQQERDVTYAPKLKKSDGLINWNDPPAVIHNKVRGFLPWPGAYTHYDGKVLKVLRTEISKVSFNSAASGEVVVASAEQGIVVHAGSGTISIKELQPEGKKAMDSGAFLLGHALKKGYRFK